MSNELNVQETFYGTLDPGVEIELYRWDTDYDTHRKRASCFSVAPDPAIPLGGGYTAEFAPGKVDLQITRVWNTVWTAPAVPGQNLQHTFQWNVALKNIGDQTAAYHLLQAETDN